MPRNLVVFADGTGQEGGQGIGSNVYRLFNMVLDRSPQQITFYDPGLGTGRRRLLPRAAGLGLSRNLLQGYRFLFDHYQCGDRIFLFGFSRGAATVRSLSGFLHLFGLLPRSRPELIPRAYALYRVRDRQRRRQEAAAFVARHHTMWARIRFLGVWDTVAALGLPVKALDVAVDRMPLLRHHFHDLSLSPSVETACHALAIDDRRKIFHPVLWEPQVKTDQRMKQVWFAGMHSDVGGGYADRSLADITLQWMTGQAADAGLKLYPRHSVRLRPDACGPMHDSTASGLARLYRRQVRTWDAHHRGLPTLHRSVLERADCSPQNGGGYDPWILRRHPRHLMED